MTQPIRIKVNSTPRTLSEKPPTLEMKKLLKEMFFKCIPCFNRRDKKDEKLPLTPPQTTSPNGDDYE